MLPTLPPALAVRSTRTWLPPDSWDLTSPGSLRSHVPVNLHAHSPRRLTHFWRKSRLDAETRQVSRGAWVELRMSGRPPRAIDGTLWEQYEKVAASLEEFNKPIRK